MNRAFLFCLLTSLVGCSTADEPADDVISLDDKADRLSSARSALPDGAEPLYFGTPSGGYVNDDAPLAYRYFAAQKGVEFKVGVSELDEAGSPIAGEHVGFKLQRAVRKNGKWTWSVVQKADSDDGAATVKYTPRSGPGLYLVTATASPLPADLTFSLACGGTGCAVAQQPGDACGGFAASRFRCDDGLYCAYSLDQQCGAGDQQGVCQVKSRICPLIYMPICGCDGQTYGNQCNAASAGTSEQRVGPCDVDVVGNWEYISPDSGSHFDYTFNADGTFVSTEQPACAFTNPRCLIKIAPATGRYHVTTTDVSLFYDDSRTADFSIDDGGTHLRGSDWGESLDLTRLP
jgi:hypothetical protein